MRDLEQCDTEVEEWKIVDAVSNLVAHYIVNHLDFFHDLEGSLWLTRPCNTRAEV
jgi:hypothetical protein